MSIKLLARHAGRPLLMSAQGADALARRVLAFDAHALDRPRGWLSDPLGALTRLGKPRAAQPGDADIDDDALIAPARPFGYTPGFVATEPTAEGLGWALHDGVACMQITGPLVDRGFVMCGEVFWGYDLIASAMREASADDRVGGIFVRMESPGGVVAGGLESATKQIRSLREAAGGKPIWVYADMAASAAYWISSAADRILASPVGLVGSIGAVIVHEDWSGAAEKAGVVVTPIQFGAKKTDGAPWAPLSAAAKADLQAEIDEVGMRFVRDVAAGRRQLSVEALIAMEAAMHLALHSDPARSGLALGLVDAIASEESAFRQLVAHVANRAAKPAAKSVPVTARAPARRDGPSRTGASPTTTTTKEAVMAQKNAGRGRIHALTPEEEDQKIAEIAEICDNGDLSSADKLTLIRGKLEDAPAEEPVEPAPEEEAEVVAEEEEPAPEEEEELAPTARKKAEGEEPAPEDEEEPTEPAARAQKILRLPEAQGRHKLATELAFSGMTVKAARRALAASPREGASRLAGIPDPKLGGGAGATRPKTADEKAAAFVNDAYARATGRKAGARK